MSQNLIIRFSVVRGDEQFFRSRLMSFQSPLRLWLRETGWGEFDQIEADGLEANLSIFGVKASKLARVKDQIAVEADRNGLSITIEPSAP